MNKARRKRIAMCECCANLIAAGDGDFICCECGQPVMSVSDYTPTDEYLECGGSKYEKN